MTQSDRPDPLDLLREAAKFLALRPSGHTGSLDDRIPWFTHGGISHGADRPDCVVCQWLAEAALSTPPPSLDVRTRVVNAIHDHWPNVDHSPGCDKMQEAVLAALEGAPE